MDASMFGFVARELGEVLRGMRVEKVFAPLPEVWTFSMGRPGHVVLCTAKNSPFVLLTPHKPENPANPTGRAMWFRKRLRDRRVLDCVVDWPRRRLALELSSGEGGWLMLDLQEGPELLAELPDGFGATPQWPPLADVLGNSEVWRLYPHLTPPLRRYLSQAPADEAHAMLERLQHAASGAFFVGRDHKGRMQASLWPFPDGQRCAGALEAAALAYASVLADRIREHSGGDRVEARAVRRLERTLDRLEDDRRRLQDMVDGRRDALDLQAGLHAVDKNARLASLQLEHEVRLDPGLTVVENMERKFLRAAKGTRGLDMVEARVEALRQELDGVRAGHIQPRERDRGSGAAVAGSLLPAKLRKLKIAAYRSSDGFLIVRGRDAQANHRLLTQAASPFDYWLHAQGGPGAHVIIKRDFVTQEVPEQTVLEAAGLAALSSHLRLAATGDVLLCLVRDVRTIKGAPLGLVEVEQVVRVVRPRIDPELESRLRIAT